MDDYKELAELVNRTTTDPFLRNRIVKISDDIGIILYGKLTAPDLIWKRHYELTKYDGDWEFIIDLPDKATTVQTNIKDLSEKEIIIFANLINIWNGLEMDGLYD